MAMDLQQIAAFLMGLFELARFQPDAGAASLALTLAVIGGLGMRNWLALDATARDAALAHMLTLGVLTLVMRDDFGMPTPLSLGFWLKLMILFLGYEIAIAGIFFAKTVGRRVIRQEG
ncbi:hypothetical protein D3C80_782720 [compost metagenome]